MSLGLVEYYSEAGPDYAAWSPAFNMHFGFYRRRLGLGGREAMLEQMNVEVHERLALPGHAAVLDLGCGLGATACSIARRSEDVTVTGVSLVPWQVAEASRRAETAGLAGRVAFVQADYSALSWPDASIDGAYAIESACYASGPGKADFLREAARVLKPGARLVVADGFRKAARMNAVVDRCYRAMCRYWYVEECAEVEAFRRCAEAAGFEDVRVEEVSWHVAPSMAYVPFVTAQFLWRERAWRRDALTARRRENAMAPLLGIVVGAARSCFGYYLISARRAGVTPQK